MTSFHETINSTARFLGRRIGEIQFGLKIAKEGILFSRFNPFAATWHQTEMHLLGQGKHLSMTSLNPIYLNDDPASHYAGKSPDEIYAIYSRGNPEVIGAAHVDENPKTPIDIYIP